jgi:outer membrane protein TolC
MEYLLNSQINKSIGKLVVGDLDLNLRSIDDYLTLAFANRPELQHNISLQRSQFFKIGVEKANFYPQVVSALSYHYARPGVNFFKDEWMDYYSFMVQLQWDFWNWGRNKRKIQQARLNYEQSQLKNEELTQDIQQQVKEVYQYLQSAKHQINLQEQLVTQEGERFRMTEDRYNQGMTTALDLSTAEHALTEAKLNLQLNYISWFKFKSQLEFACGVIGANIQEVTNEN